MYAKITSCSLYGLLAEKTIVEADINPGLPALTVVGLPDISVRESKERIRSAINNSGFKFPARRITINLAPASTKKEGTHFDLPIAVGIMVSCGYIKGKNASEYAFLGELSLDGQIKSIKGTLPLVIGLRKNKIKKVIVPFENAREASTIDDIEIYPARNLIEISQHLNGKNKIDPYKNKNSSELRKHIIKEDFSEVAGQENVKRAMQISAAAAHNMILIGPPGAGKTMMARRMPGILPEMTYDEKLEVTKIYSISGNITEENPIVNIRPFRAPHHSISAAALIGGGTFPKPGEISLAHFGILFLDELPEFKRDVLEMLRQPMEDEKVNISRLRDNITFPSKFILLASMNPCPYGC